MEKRNKVSRIGLFLANPMVAKLDRVEEHDDTISTAKGITWKTIFLLLVTILGIATFFLTSNMIPTTYVETIENIEVNMIEAGIALGGLLIALLFPFIAFKFVRASMVLGTLYSFIQGYALAFLFHFVGTEFVYPAMFALVLTIAVVVVMMFLYRMKIVRIDHKFISVVATTFFMMCILGLLYFVFSQIPTFDEYTKYLQDNNVIFITVGMIGIVISSLFLLVDFEVLHHCVDDQLPKKYEWLAAFALSFAIIELYLKIFNFVLRLMGSKNNEN